jgi:uncharacterized protein YidB (DUF937 family)
VEVNGMDDLTKTVSQGGSTGAAGTTDPAALLGGLESAGGLDGLLDKLRGAGLGDAVDSWVSTGENKPVDPAALGQALGPDTVQKLSGGTGIDVGQLLPMLAAFLPQIVNMLTPNGNVPSGGRNCAAGSLPDLGGLLGGLMGGSAGSGATVNAGLDDILGGLGGALGGQKR